MRIFVANFPFTTTDEELREFIEAAGFPCGAVKVVHDRVTGNSRGFGFVEILSEETDLDVCTRLTGLSMGGRSLAAAPATPQRTRGY